MALHEQSMMFWALRFVNWPVAMAAVLSIAPATEKA